MISTTSLDPSGGPSLNYLSSSLAKYFSLLLSLVFSFFSVVSIAYYDFFSLSASPIASENGTNTKF